MVCKCFEVDLSWECLNYLEIISNERSRINIYVLKFVQHRVMYFF